MVRGGPIVNKLLTLHIDHASIGGQRIRVDADLRVELPIDGELASARQELIVQRQTHELELARLRLRMQQLEEPRHWWQRSRR